MNHVVYLFGSGLAFFLGIGLLLGAVVLFARGVLRVVATLAAMLGSIAIAASATPLPYGFYAVAGSVSVFWLVAERSARPRLLAWRPWLRAAVALVWMIGAAMELPYHLQQTVVASGRPTLYVLGDSISAGLNEGEQGTWPQVLARSHPVEVVDLSRMGATATTAIKQADGLPAEDGLVLVEIGGNDMLGSTTVAEFEAGLDRLLGRVCKARRVVVMFELPLPPFHNDFGRVQRRLAEKHGVALIPKRVLLGVIVADGLTLDSLHLSPEGHRRLAEAVWELIRPAYESRE